MRVCGFSLKRMVNFGVLLMMGTSMSACGSSWKEEVLLHDGNKIVVNRSQTYGGRHEIGQSAPVKEHTLTFDLPGSNKKLQWTSEYSDDIGRTNFNLLALHVLNGTPYLVAEPNLCLSYNKWGRPNPPYVIFKYKGEAWQRIQLSELPEIFKTINLIVNNGREEDIEKAARKSGCVLAESIQKINSSLTQLEYKSILREPLPQQRIIEMCGDMVQYRGHWIMRNSELDRLRIDRILDERK